MTEANEEQTPAFITCSAEVTVDGKSTWGTVSYVVAKELASVTYPELYRAAHQGYLQSRIEEEYAGHEVTITFHWSDKEPVPTPAWLDGGVVEIRLIEKEG